MNIVIIEFRNTKDRILTKGRWYAATPPRVGEYVSLLNSLPRVVKAVRWDFQERGLAQVVVWVGLRSRRHVPKAARSEA